MRGPLPDARLRAPLSDAVEGITHSLCTLGVRGPPPAVRLVRDKVDLAGHPELLKPLTDRGLPLEAGKPRQIEFSRLNLNYTVMSKRKLMTSQEGPGRWLDDPRI